MTSLPIRVVVVDDHMVTCAGIVALLGNNPNLSVVGIGQAGEHVLRLLREHEPDVLLMDLQMHLYEADPRAGMFQPISTLEVARDRHPHTAVVVISQEQDIYTISSLAEIGVKGYFLKSDRLTVTLGAVVEQIHLGGTYFSPAVRQIIEQMPKLKRSARLTRAQRGVLQVLLQYPELARTAQAEKLGIAPVTFQKHIGALFEALHVTNMESCLVKAMRMRLDGLPDDDAPDAAVVGDDAVGDPVAPNRPPAEAPAILCRKCGSSNISRNGLTSGGKQKYLCKACSAYGTSDQTRAGAAPM